MEARTYAEKFMDELRRHSKDKQDPVSEWIIGASEEYESHCICGKDIHIRYHITNRLTGNFLWIGKDCAERWLDASLYCKTCDCALGNVMNRRRHNDFLCRACKHKSKKNDEFVIKSLKNYKCLIHPYYGLEFFRTTDDIKFVEKILNMTSDKSYITSLQKYYRAVFVLA